MPAEKSPSCPGISFIDHDKAFCPSNSNPYSMRLYACAIARHYTGSNCGGFWMIFCTNKWRSALATITLVVACSTAAYAQEQRRLYTPPDLATVRAVSAQQGMVVAQEKLAARIG